MNGVLDDYLVDPKITLLDKTRMQAQVLVPVLRALRAELGTDKADAIVTQALRDWSKQHVIAPTGMLADGWDTALCVLGEIGKNRFQRNVLGGRALFFKPTGENVYK